MNLLYAAARNMHLLSVPTYYWYTYQLSDLSMLERYN